MELRILALACLVGAALAGPVQRQSENQCSTTCKNVPNSRIKYEAGKSYIYKYNSRNNLLLAGIRKGLTTLEAQVEYHFHSPCEGTLKMKKVNIQQKGPQEDKDDLTRKLELPVKYIYENGTLVNICPSSKESTESVNMKKSILSLLVNELPDNKNSGTIEENDSLGKCSTDYAVHTENGDTVIKKVKDLASCSDDKGFIEHLKKKLPLFSEKRLECEERIKNGVVKNKQCQEKHKIRSPFEDNKGILEFQSTVDFRHTETKSADKPSFEESYKREEITYSTTKYREGDRNVRAAKRIVKELCSNPKEHVKKMAQLKSHLETCTEKDLHEIYELVKDPECSPKVREYFVDTLAQVSYDKPDEALPVLLKITVDENRTGYKTSLLCARIASWSPTNKTVAATFPLLKWKNIPALCEIGTASMFYKYCKGSKPNRDQTEICGKVAAILNEKVKSARSANDERKMISALRFAGNSGVCRKPYTSSQAILDIASNKTVSLRVRLAAMDAYRRVNEVPKKFVDMSTDPDENIQVRCSAMKEVMHRGDEKQVDELLEAAKSESNEQALSFLITLVRNAKNTRSHNRHRQLIKNHLQNTKLNPTLLTSNLDFYTSRNLESTVSVEALNASASHIANMMLDENRAPSILGSKIQVTLFNQTLDLIELQGLVENGGNLAPLFRRFWEIKERLPKYEDILARIEQKPSFEEIKEEFKYLSPNKIFGDTKFPELSMLIRMFGHEFWGASTSEWSSIKEMAKIAESMSKLSQGEKIDWSHSSLVLDSKLHFPSVTGRLYSLEVAGSSTVGISADTKADFLNLPRNADIHVDLEPRASFEVAMKAAIRSGSEVPDVKVVSSMHAESNFNAKLKWNHGNLRAEYFPAKTIASLKFDTTVVETDNAHNEKPVHEKMQKKIDYHVDFLKKALGIGLNFTVKVADPFIMKKAPYVMPVVSAEMVMEKTDDKMKSYELVFSTPNKPSPVRTYKFSFNTSGSDISRLHEVNVEVKPEEASLHVGTPYGAAGGKVSYTKKDDMMEGSFELRTEKKQFIFAKVTVNHTNSLTKKLCEGSLSVSVFEEKPKEFRIKSEYIHTKTKEKVVFESNSTLPFSVKATLMKEGSKISGDITANTTKGHLGARATLHKKPQQISGNLVLDRKVHGEELQTVAVGGTLNDKTNKRFLHLKYRNYRDKKVVKDYDLKFDRQKQSEDSIWNRVQLLEGGKTNNPIAEFEQNSYMPETGPGHCFVRIKVPSYEIHHQLNGTYSIEYGKMDIGFKYKNKQDEHITADVNAEFKSNQNAEIKANADIKGVTFRIEGRIKQTDNVLEIKSEVRREEVKLVDLNIKLLNKSNDSKYHREIQGSIQTPSRTRRTFDVLVQINKVAILLKAQEGRNMAQVKIRKDGSSSLEIKHGDNDITLNFTEVDHKKTLDADFKVGSRHCTALAIVEYGEEKKLKIEVIPDRENPGPGNTHSLTAVAGKHGCSLKLNIPDWVDVHLEGRGEFSLWGNSELVAEASNKKLGNSAIKVRLENDDNEAKLTSEFKLNDKKFHSELVARRDKKVSSFEASIIGPNLDVRVHLNKKENPSESSKFIQTLLHCRNEDKVFKIGSNFTIQSNGLKFKSEMIHEKLGKNTLEVSLSVTKNTIGSSVRFDGEGNKKFSLETDIKTSDSSLSIVSDLDSSFSKSGQVKLILNNDYENKSIEGSMYVDKKRYFGFKGIRETSQRTTKSLCIIELSDPKAKLKAIDIEMHSSPTRTLLSTSVKMNNGKEYLLDSDCKAKNDHRSVNTTLQTPELILGLFLKHEPSKCRGFFNYDTKEKRVVTFESGYDATKGVEFNALLQTDKTLTKLPEISVNVTYKKNENSISASADVVKGTSPLLSTSLNRLSYHGGEKLLMKANRYEENLLYVEISDDASGKSSDQNRLKVKVQVPDYSLSSSINPNDRNSYSYDTQVCQKRKGICHTLKARYENSKDKQSSFKHPQVYSKQKLTIVFGKSARGSPSKAIVSLNTSLDIYEHGIKSNFIVENHPKRSKLGYDIKININQEDRCTLHSRMFLPKSICTVTGSIEHKPNRMKIVANANLDTNDSTNKRNFGFEMVKETEPDGKESSLSVKVDRPKGHPLTSIQWKLLKVDDGFVKAECLFQHEDLKYTFQVVPNIKQGMRSLNISISDDKAGRSRSLQIFRDEYKNAVKVGCKMFDGDKLTRGMVVTCFSKLGLKGMKWEMSAPSANYEVEGSVESTNDINFNIASAGKKLQEFSIRTYGRCVNYKLEHPLITGEICGPNWRPTANGLEYQVVNLRMEHNGSVVAVFEVNFNDEIEDEHHIDIISKCNKKEIQELLKSIHFDRWDQKVRELVDNLNEKVQDLLQKMKSHYSRELRRCRELKRIYVSVIEDYFSKFQEVKGDVMRYIISMIPESFKEHCNKYYQHLQKVCEHLSWSELCQSYSKYWENMKSVVRRFDGKIKVHLLRIVKRCKQSLKFSTPSLQSFIPGFFRNILKEYVLPYLKDKLMPFMEKSMSTAEAWVRERAIEIVDWMIKKTHDIFSSDKDLQNAQELIVNAKNKIVNTWNNREKIAEASVRDLEQSSKENLKKVLDKYVEVLKNDPKEGEYAVRIHPHFSLNGIDNLKKKLVSLIRRIEEIFQG